MTRTACLALIALAPLVELPAAAPDLRAELLRLWPAGVQMPEGMRLYQRSVWAQRLVILNGHDDLRIVREDQDDHFGNAPTRPNPNRLHPWAKSGGLHSVTNWSSRTALALPRGGMIHYWSERVEAGASRSLPMVRWQFPTGTVFADILSYGGKVSEWRLAEKTKDGWRRRVVWRQGERPAGYHMDRTCVQCHEKAGGDEGYGVRVRGSGGVFSFWPFVADSFTPRTDFPVKHWND